jgi:hypothetical protein
MLFELPALIVAAITFAIPIVFSSFKKTPVRYIYIGLFLRHAIALLNSYVVTIPGAEMDAANFFEDAVYHARNCQAEWSYVPGLIYSYLLGKIFCFTGISKLLGSEFSILAYSFSAAIIIKITEDLNFDKGDQEKTFALFSFMPAFVFYSSITMRESFQMLFLMCSVYAGISLRRKFNIYKLLIGILSAIALGSLHHGLSFYSLLLILILVFWGFKLDVSNYRNSTIRILVIISMITISTFSFVLINQLSGGLADRSDGDISKAAISYREGTAEEATFARANYSSLQITSPIELILYYPYLLFLYMFAPLPWQVNAPSDIVIIIENIIRFVLIRNLLSYRKILSSQNQNGALYIYLFICFISIESIWAIGTNNWGASIRHHVPAHGILCIIGNQDFSKNKDHEFPKNT